MTSIFIFRSFFRNCKSSRSLARLPQRSTVVDLLENRTLADKVKEFPLVMAPNSFENQL